MVVKNNLPKENKKFNFKKIVKNNLNFMYTNCTVKIIMLYFLFEESYQRKSCLGKV